MSRRRNRNSRISRLLIYKISYKVLNRKLIIRLYYYNKNNNRCNNINRKNSNKYRSRTNN